ncbi:MAG: hypothetical protein CL946_00330 [Ectothiorhodospiraceae bacterium]|nr:hypothetical protein [Ectothiorhodospiraceae bacterium]
MAKTYSTQSATDHVNDVSESLPPPGRFEFDVGKGFFSHKMVWTPFFAIMGVSALSCLPILATRYRGFCGPDMDCYREFVDSILTDFEFPIKTAAAGIAVLLLQIAVYRSKQDLRQQRPFQDELTVVNEQLILAKVALERESESALIVQYYAHKEQFKNEMKAACCDDDGYDELTVSRLHRKLFPSARAGNMGLDYTHLLVLREDLTEMRNAAQGLAEALRECARNGVDPRTTEFPELLTQLIEVCWGLRCLRHNLAYQPRHFGELLRLIVPSRIFDDAARDEETISVSLAVPTSVNSIVSQLNMMSRLLAATGAFQDGFHPDDCRRELLSEVLFEIGQIARFLDEAEYVAPQKNPSTPFGLAAAGAAGGAGQPLLITVASIKDHVLARRQQELLSRDRESGARREFYLI